MSETDAHLEQCLQRVLQTALGPGYASADLTRLRGGTKKDVYRAKAEDRSVILYVWNHPESHRPTGECDVRDDVCDLFADASGVDLFVAANYGLQSLGVRTPELYFLDTSRAELPADVAMVEDIQGGTLEQFWCRCPGDTPLLMSELGHMLQRIHIRRSSSVGKLACIESAIFQDARCEHLALARALSHLNHASTRIDRLGAAKDALGEALQSLASAVTPRVKYSLIHGELGPDHVLVDSQSHPVIIDIEGLMFCDVKWEHAFLAIRFGEHYHALREIGLDETRLRFYTLCLRLSLCSGPLRLLDGDFPDRDMMTGIIEWNGTKALEFIQ